jgi:hypothetical protein
VPHQPEVLHHIATESRSEGSQGQAACDGSFLERWPPATFAAHRASKCRDGKFVRFVEAARVTGT